MDRTGTYGAVGGPAMRPGGAAAVELLLRADGHGERREPAADETNRRALPEAAVLRIAEDDRLAPGSGLVGQREAGGATDAGDGAASHCARATYESSASQASGVSVSAARPSGPGAEPGLVCRHHVHSPAVGLPVLGGGDGLVQPVCAGVGIVELAGDRFLPAGVDTGFGAGQARYFQHRPGIPIHERGVHGTLGGERYPRQHGRARPGHGQHFRGAAVANGQVRGHLSARLCRRGGHPSRLDALLPVLQHTEAASGARQTNPGRGAFFAKLRGAPPPRGGGRGEERRRWNDDEPLAYATLETVQRMGGSSIGRRRPFARLPAIQHQYS